MATRSKDPATLASHGKKFMEESKYDEALELYNLAITYKPDSPLYHIQRSICHQRLTKYQEAVDDAEVALFLAHKLGKRELKAQAQLRRGISYFFLHRLGDAEQCLKWSQKLDDKEKSLKLWIPKVEEGLKKCEADDERRKATVAEVPDVSDKVKAAEKSASTPTTKPTPVATSAIKQAVGVTMSVDNIKEEWFQSNTHVTFTLYVKGVPKDKAVVSLEPRSFSIAFPLANGSEYSCDKDPLFAEIDTANSSYSILGTKVELRLKKKVEHKKWLGLEGEADSLPAPAAEEPESRKSKVPEELLKSAKPPSYPTSSKNGPVNWDKLEVEDDGVDDEGDPVNALFKSIYKGADDDTKRAMMKSFVESNGTALSTNWEEVGKKKMQVTPPEGMEAKPYEI